MTETCRPQSRSGNRAPCLRGGARPRPGLLDGRTPAADLLLWRIAQLGVAFRVQELDGQHFCMLWHGAGGVRSDGSRRRAPRAGRSRSGARCSHSAPRVRCGRRGGSGADGLRRAPVPERSGPARAGGFRASAPIDSAAVEQGAYDLVVIGSGPGGPEGRHRRGQARQAGGDHRPQGDGRRRVPAHRNDPVQDAARGDPLPFRHRPARLLRSRLLGQAGDLDRRSRRFGFRPSWRRSSRSCAPS